MDKDGLKKKGILEEEKALIHHLRYNEKLKYTEIAQKVNRSLYWVHTRLSEKYQPATARVEKRFQDEEVLAFLKNEGHKIINEDTRTRCREFSQEVDILSLKEGVVYVTEVKNIVNHHQIQTGIGQLILHKFAYQHRYPEREHVVYQLVFPKEFINYRYFTEDFLNYMKGKIGIGIIFI